MSMCNHRFLILLVSLILLCSKSLAQQSSPQVPLRSKSIESPSDGQPVDYGWRGYTRPTGEQWKHATDSYYSFSLLWALEEFQSLRTDPRLMDSWTERMKESAATSWNNVAESSRLGRDTANELFESSKAWLSTLYEKSSEATLAFSNELYTSASTGTQYAVTKTKTGPVAFYEKAADGTAKVVNWSEQKYRDLTRIDVCEMKSVDAAGGFATGVALTSFFSGVDVIGAALLMVPTAFGWVPMIAVATSPAIPAAATVAAGAGVVIYASTKGYCWWRGPLEG